MKVEVDGDIIVFRAGFGAEHMVYDIVEDGSPLATVRYKKEAVEYVKQHPSLTIEPRRVVEPLENALHNVNTLMQKIRESLGVEKRDVTVWLSGPSEENFRKKIATIQEYKGHRKEAWRPTYEQEIKRFLVQKHRAEIAYGEEADDALGIEMCSRPFGSTCIVTVDKDLDMIPGLHYNFVTDQRYVVDEQTANWCFWRQMLTGDATDNILGIPGIGEKRSYDLLAEIWDDEEAMREKVWSLYVQTYGLAAWPALLETGRLLWIRRKPGELWHPFGGEDE